METKEYQVHGKIILLPVLYNKLLTLHTINYKLYKAFSLTRNTSPVSLPLQLVKLIGQCHIINLLSSFLSMPQSLMFTSR